MLAKKLDFLLKPSNLEILFKRNWTQVGHVVCVPPRRPSSYASTVMYMGFMYVAWLSPVAYFLSQVKVWRKKYIQ